MGTLAQPVPEPAARPTAQITGVVLGDTLTGERVEYSDVLQVEWTDTTVVMTGALSGSGPRGAAPITTTTYSLADVGAVLVRELDANRTSFFVAGVIIGVTVIGTLLFTGKTTTGTPLGQTGG